MLVLRAASQRQPCMRHAAKRPWPTNPRTRASLGCLPALVPALVPHASAACPRLSLRLCLTCLMPGQVPRGLCGGLRGRAAAALPGARQRAGAARGAAAAVRRCVRAVCCTTWLVRVCNASCCRRCATCCALVLQSPGSFLLALLLRVRAPTAWCRHTILRLYRPPPRRHDSCHGPAVPHVGVRPRLEPQPWRRRTGAFCLISSWPASYAAEAGLAGEMPLRGVAQVGGEGKGSRHGAGG